MTEQQWQYLTHLTRALDEAGVRGDRIGELVAELASHLEEDDVDPVEEFGAPFHMARDLAGNEDLVPKWMRSFAAKAVAMTIAMAGAAVAVAAIESDPAQITTGSLGYAVGLGLLILTVRAVLARRLDGRSIWSTVTPGTLAVLFGGASIVTWMAMSERLLATWSRPSAIGGAIALIVVSAVLARWASPPITFPPHAQHLDRLRQLVRLSAQR